MRTPPLSYYDPGRTDRWSVYTYKHPNFPEYRGEMTGTLTQVNRKARRAFPDQLLKIEEVFDSKLITAI